MLTDDITEALESAAAQQPYQMRYEPAIALAGRIRRRRRQASAVGVLAVVAAAGVSWGVLAGRSASSDDQLRIAPATQGPSSNTLKLAPLDGLRPGQTVTLSGSGFVSATRLSVRECASTRGGAQSLSRNCEIDRAATVTIDRKGAFSLTYQVSQTVWTRNFGEVYCAQAAQCALSVSVKGSDTAAADVPLPFAKSSAARALPFVTLNRNGQLSDGTPTTVTGHGFNPSQFVDIRECPAMKADCTTLPAIGQVFTDAAGSISGDIRLRTTIETATSKTSCASDCTLLASNTAVPELSVRSPAFDVPQTASVPKTGQSGDPTWLPAGARLQSRLPFGATGVLLSYGLPGAANANTIPSGGITEGNALTVHPASIIQVSSLPGVSVAIPASGHLNGAAYSDVSVSGQRGVLSLPTNGFGTYRLEWNSSTGYHTVTVDRLTTPEGTSGVTSDELLHIARSIR